MEVRSSQHLTLCYCYAYEDHKYAGYLENHLASLKTNKIIQTSHPCIFYRKGPRLPEIADYLKTDHFVLLLISAPFLYSYENWYRRDIEAALKRQERGEAYVIPIFLSNVDLEGTPFCDLQMWPGNDEYIIGSRDREGLLTNIVRKIRKMADEMKASRSIESEPVQGEFSSQAAFPSDLPSSLVQPTGLQCISWSLDADWLAIGMTDGTIRIYNVSDGSLTYFLPGHTGDVYSVAWSTNTMLASGSADGTVRLWEIGKKSAVRILRGHTGIVNSVAWSGDAVYVVSGSADKTVRLWDTRDGSSLHIWTNHTQRVMSVAWSPNDLLLASGSYDRRVCRWDPRSGRELLAFQQQSEIMSVTWSPDGGCLAVGLNDKTIQIWDATTRQALSLLQGHTGAVTAVTWSPDGRYLASSSRDRTVCLWQADSGNPLRILRVHQQGVLGLAWSPDSQQLATVSHTELYLWHAETGKQIRILDSQQRLRKVIRQPESVQRVDILQNDDESVSEEFPELERKKRETKRPDEEKSTITCSQCHTLLSQKEINHRRRLGRTYIECSTCHTLVSLLDNREQAIDSQTFDVFLCHNDQDKSAVKCIGEQLKGQGILPWLDEWELRPGLPRETSLEQQIALIKAAAVFVGQSGIGPWQRIEINAFLREFAERGCPIIPVLLPDAPIKPDLPLFLRGNPWVDFRLQEPDPMQRLLWGITGKKQ